MNGTHMEGLVSSEMIVLRESFMEIHECRTL
jgi:hypothetical protein